MSQKKKSDKAPKEKKQASEDEELKTGRQVVLYDGEVVDLDDLIKNGMSEELYRKCTTRTPESERAVAMALYGKPEKVLYGQREDVNLLQSWFWLNYLRLEGQETYCLKTSGFTAVVTKIRTPLGYYLYCPYGPVLNEKSLLEDEDKTELMREAMVHLAWFSAEHNAIFIRVEPRWLNPEEPIITKDDMLSMGLKKTRDVNPAHTWVLDLTAPKEGLLAGMPKNKTRCWRNYAKKGLKIRTSNSPWEISVLSSLLKKVAKRNDFTPQTERHLRNQMKLGTGLMYVLELDEKPIAAALVHDYNGVRYYLHAAADEEYRRLEPGAILLIQMIMDAKDLGLKEFDFWGITTSEDKNHPWYGFTQFKKSFGGKEVDYLGTWDLPIYRSRYRLYRALRAINRWKRKRQHR